MNLLSQDTYPSPNIPFGYCHCGCGEKTRLATQNHTKFGYLKGLPVRYMFGHGQRKRPVLVNGEPFLIDRQLCRTIPLTKGQCAIVDADRYIELMQWPWWAMKGEHNLSWYAVRLEYGTRRLIMMHRLIANPPDDVEIDHENLNGLDNRRLNLRFASRSQNGANLALGAANTSGFKGVTPLPSGKWRSGIRYEGVYYHLGCFIRREDATEAYRQKAVELFGEFARY